MFDPVPPHQASDPQVAWEAVLDVALHAAQLEVDGRERRRLTRILVRLAPDAASGDEAVVAAPVTAVKFERLLQSLARV